MNVADICTPDLCDDNPGAVAIMHPLLRNFGGKSAFGGEIVTVKCFEDNALVKEQAGLPGRGRVLVVDGGGSHRHALLGDVIGGMAVSNGWAGFIIYGSVRDVDALAQLDLGVQAIGPIPLRPTQRGIGDLNVPVIFGGVQFAPGHFAYADNNGVIVSPKALL